MLILEENFRWHLEAFASELFIHTHTHSHIPAEFRFNPNQTPDAANQVCQVYLKTKCVGTGLELNSAWLLPSKN